MMEQNDDLKLFTEFPPVSTKQWEEKIIQDLKGADYEKKLIWKPVAGLNIRPYYRMEDLKPLAHMGSMPGAFPFVRGNKANSNRWELRQIILVDKPPMQKPSMPSNVVRMPSALRFRT
jgi:methylmalonyl-CoA mutase